MKRAILIGVLCTSIVLLTTPMIPAIQLNESIQCIREKNSANISQIFTFIKSNKVTQSSLINIIQKLLQTYLVIFIIVFFSSLLITVPVAIWITYFGNIIEILITAITLSFVTALKWPILLLDIIQKLLQNML